MKKRISAFLLSVVLCLGLVGTAFAAETASVKFTAGEDALTVSLTGLGKEATYALGGLLVKKQADSAFALAESLDFKTDADGAYTGTFESLKGLTSGDQIGIYLPGVTFTSDDAKDVKDSSNGSLMHTFAEEEDEPKPVTAVTLPKTLSVKVGKTGTLTAALEPKDGSYKTIAWASSDDTAATVAQDKSNPLKATVKGVKEGTATVTVTVTLADGTALTASCSVTVSKSTSGGGGGGGGGSSTSGDYSIGVNRTSNGSVSVNPSRADEGDTVTITVRPHKGYELDKLTVKDEDGKTIRVTDAGDGKYTFVMPDGKVTVEATFKVLVAEPEVSVPSFNDVPAGFWAYDQITWAAEKGIMGGYGNGVFAPGRSTTRQALWMVLARLNGAAPADMAAARAWAVQSGVSDGSNPTASMSRQQMVTMLYRYAQQKGYDTSARADLGQFPDNASVAGYAKEALSWAVASGVMGGTSSGTLNPGGTASRAHFAVFMHRFCTLYQIA